MSKYGHINSKPKTPVNYYPYTYGENENESKYLDPKNLRGNSSPYGYRNRSVNQSSGLDSIQNMMESRRSNNPFAYGTKEYRSYESEEIVFLKEKLIETHNKLLKELENSQKLEQEAHFFQNSLRVLERAHKQLEQRAGSLESELDQTKRLLSHRVQKNEQKYKSVQGKLQSENRRNIQLKEDLQSVRNKMMEVGMQKNMLEEANAQFKVQIKHLMDSVEHLEAESREKNEKNNSLINQLNQTRQKLQLATKQIEDLQADLEELGSKFNSKKSNEKELEHLLSLERDKNINLQHEVSDLQSYNINLQDKILKLEKDIQKDKQEIYWLQQNKQSAVKDLNDQISKITQELESMSYMYKEVERELDVLKKKPIQQAEKKRRHYEITKEFVHQLQNEQQLYGNSGSRALGRTPPSQNATIRASRGVSPTSINFTNKNVSPTSRNHGYFQNKVSSINSNSYSKEMMSQKEQRGGSIEKKEKIAQLDGVLFSCNLERKKIKAQIERIESNNVKTREMIVKKKKLEEQLQFQEQKIKKVKQDLRKLRVI